MNNHLKPIAETNNFIVLDQYIRIDQPDGSYQSEPDLERELIGVLKKSKKNLGCLLLNFSKEAPHA